MTTLTRRAWFGLVAVLPFLRPKPAYVMGMLRRSEPMTFPMHFDKPVKFNRVLFVRGDRMGLPLIKHSEFVHEVGFESGGLAGRSYDVIHVFKPVGMTWAHKGLPWPDDRRASPNRDHLMVVEDSWSATRWNEWMRCGVLTRLNRGGKLFRFDFRGRPAYAITR